MEITTTKQYVYSCFVSLMKIKGDFLPFQIYEKRNNVVSWFKPKQLNGDNFIETEITA